MNKIIFIILLSVFSLSSCTNEKKTIEFKKIANLELGTLSKDNATLTGTVVFVNLSDEEYNLKDMVLDFTIDGKDIGTVVTKIKRVIKPNSEFSVPIQYAYETKSFIEPGAGPEKTYAVELSGDLVSKNLKGEELITSVKFVSTYEYLTKKEKRIEKREAKKTKEEENKGVNRKEERRKRREERKANKNN